MGIKKGKTFNHYRVLVEQADDNDWFKAYIGQEFEVTTKSVHRNQPYYLLTEAEFRKLNGRDFNKSYKLTKLFCKLTYSPLTK